MNSARSISLMFLTALAGSFLASVVLPNYDLLSLWAGMVIFAAMSLVKLFVEVSSNPPRKSCRPGCDRV